MPFSEVLSLNQASKAPWYALYTRHQHEKTVAGTLANKGFEVFLPLYNAAHRWRDRTKQLSLPLLPCYVFLRTGGREWLPVLSTPGVHMVVGYGGHAAPIAEAEIDAIRRAAQNSTQIGPHPFLKCGDWVRVKSGPLENIEGILVRTKNSFRLILSVEMLRKSVFLEVDVATVERIARRSERRVAQLASVAPQTHQGRAPA